MILMFIFGIYRHLHPISNSRACFWATRWRRRGQFAHMRLLLLLSFEELYFKLESYLSQLQNLTYICLFRSSCTGSQYQKQPPNEPPSNSHQLGSGNFCIPACEDLFQDNCQSDACQRNIRQKEPTSITVNPSVQTGAEQADDSFFKEKGSYPDSASPNYLNEDVSNNSRPGHLSANEVFCVGRRRQAIQQRKLRRKALQSERLTFKIEIAYYGPGFQVTV